jgi:hypothetical protein
MTEDADLQTMAATMLKLGETCFTTGNFDSTYHLLAAAMHWAAAHGDIPTLEYIEQRATAYLIWIDEYAPTYHHATAAAAQRGNVGIYTTLTHQAAALRVRLQATAVSSTPHPPSQAPLP